MALVGGSVGSAAAFLVSVVSEASGLAGHSVPVVSLDGEGGWTLGVDVLHTSSSSATSGSAMWVDQNWEVVSVDKRDVVEVLSSPGLQGELGERCWRNSSGTVALLRVLEVKCNVCEGLDHLLCRIRSRS